RDVFLPITLIFGRKQVRLLGGEKRDSILRTLSSLPVPPGDLTIGSSRFPVIPNPNDLENIVRWLQATMEVLNAAANSEEFFQKAARAVVDIVGLDSGRVLLHDNGRWRSVAVWTGPNVHVAPEWQPSGTVLTEMCDQKRTFWQSPEMDEESSAESLMGVDIVVAAPILDRRGNVIGTLYGECRESPARQNRRLSKVEAMLVELLAGGIATGLARIEQEKVAVEADVRFKQFFTP